MIPNGKSLISDGWMVRILLTIHGGSWESLLFIRDKTMCTAHKHLVTFGGNRNELVSFMQLLFKCADDEDFQKLIAEKMGNAYNEATHMASYVGELVEDFIANNQESIR
jgi:hypothetical protein